MATKLMNPSSIGSYSSSLEVRSSAQPQLRSQFWGFSKSFLARQQQQANHCCLTLQASASLQVAASTTTTAPWLRWWEKDGAANMLEISSMQQFIDELTNAEDRLVIVEFYSRGCTGCRSLYPKLCKIAREHPEVIFLKINFDENTDICKALNVRMLPFFLVYKAQGRLESFTCTISKIQRLKDAIAKYKTKVPTILAGALFLQQDEKVPSSSPKDIVRV